MTDRRKRENRIRGRMRPPGHTEKTYCHEETKLGFRTFLPEHHHLRVEGSDLHSKYILGF